MQQWLQRAVYTHVVLFPQTLSVYIHIYVYTFIYENLCASWWNLILKMVWSSVVLCLIKLDLQAVCTSSMQNTSKPLWNWGKMHAVMLDVSAMKCCVSDVCTCKTGWNVIGALCVRAKQDVSVMCVLWKVFSVCKVKVRLVDLRPQTIEPLDPSYLVQVWRHLGMSFPSSIATNVMRWVMSIKGSEGGAGKLFKGVRVWFCGAVFGSNAKPPLVWDAAEPLYSVIHKIAYFIR